MTSGIEFRSRLEQLRALRAQIDLEIRAEEAKDLGGRVDGPSQPRLSPAAAFLKSGERLSVQQLLERLGVPSYHVKVWAFERRLIAEIHRGRISRELVEAFALAHPHLCTDQTSNQSGVAS